MSSTTTTSTSSRTARRRAVALTIAAAAVCSLIVAPRFSPAGATKPEDMIQTTAARVLEVLRNDALSTDEKASELETFLDNCCDFPTTSKLVLAQNWKRLSSDEQNEFTRLFKQYLIVTYRDNINSYGGESVEVTGGREEKFGDYTVFTRITGGNVESVIVNYRLRQGDGDEWLIIDVIAEGISLISNLRSQFKEVISARGTAGLMDSMRKKVEDLDKGLQSS